LANTVLIHPARVNIKSGKYEETCYINDSADCQRYRKQR
jgi:hypothetical protein